MKRIDCWSRIVRRVVVCTALGALVMSCSSDNTSPSTAASTTNAASSAPSTDVCADRDALSASVGALKNVDVRAQGTNGVNAAINAVKDDLAALRVSAGSALQPQVQAVQDAIDQAETAASNISSGGAAQAAPALSNLVSTSKTLLDSLDAGPCGSSAPPTT